MMSQVAQASQAKDVGPRETRDLARRGLRVVEESGRFVIEPEPLVVHRMAFQLLPVAGAFLLTWVACKREVAASQLVAAAVCFPGILALEYALSRYEASRGPFLVADFERRSIETPRSGGAFPIEDVDSVTLHRGSYGGPVGLDRAAWLGLSARRAGSVVKVPIAWSWNVDQVGEVAARLSLALNRPMLITPGDGS